MWQDDPASTNDPSIARQWAEWRISRRRLLKATALGGSVAMAASLSGGFGPLAQLAAAQGEPKPGGSISMSLADDDVQSFDPIAVTDNMSIWTQVLIYDQLIRNGKDGKSLEPGLAEKWDVSPDKKTYTFHLRDAKFHDGSAVTADDVVYSLNRAVKAQGSQWAFIFSAVDKLTAQDPKTVVITLKSVWAPFEADLALFAASIIPKKLHEAQKDNFFQHPVGSGPFKFDSWEKGSKIILKKNPDFWETGKPYLDQLEFDVLTDANARMLQFQGSQLDIATDVPYSQLEGLKANPDVQLVTDAVARFDYIGINNTRKPFDDVKLRQAINYAVNKDSIIQNVLFGAGKPANTYLPLMAGHDDSVPGYPYNLDKAKELVAQSAGKDGWQGELIVGAGDPVGSQIAQLVAADLAKIGGKIKITQVDPGLFTDRVHNKQDVDMYKSYYTTDIIDPDELTTFSVQGSSGTKSVWTNYNNPKVDQLITQAEQESDPDKRTQIYNQIQSLTSADAHVIYLFYPTGRTAVQKGIHDFHILPTGNYRLWEVWRED